MIVMCYNIESCRYLQTCKWYAAGQNANQSFGAQRKKIDFRDVSISVNNEIRSIIRQIEKVLGKRE